MFLFFVLAAIVLLGLLIYFIESTVFREPAREGGRQQPWYANRAIIPLVAILHFPLFLILAVYSFSWAKSGGAPSAWVEGVVTVSAFILALPLGLLGLAMPDLFFPIAMANAVLWGFMVSEVLRAIARRGVNPEHQLLQLIAEGGRKATLEKAASAAVAERDAAQGAS